MTAHQTARVVVVEDDDKLRQLLRAYLETQGFDVVADTPNGERGLELTIDLRPDAVILDWTLHGPGLDGEDTLICLRHRAADVPVVVFTGHTAATAVESGAAAVVDKGSPLSRLTAALAGAVAQRS